MKKYFSICVQSIKIDCFDYAKHFINRINEVYDFSLQYHLFCCNQTCNYVGMVSVTSASRYVT